MKKYILLLLLCSSVLAGCKEDSVGQYPTDNMAPGKITNVKVENIEGGAVITYDIPVDDDALYVKADYALDDGTPMEIKSSIYTNKLIIEGIGKSRELPVVLTVVDRSQNESAPVIVKINPLDAPIFSILESLTVQNDFGGILLKWENPGKTPIIIDVLSPGPDMEYIGIERFYSESMEGKANVRGQESVETIYSIIIRDRWGNTTDTITDIYFPIYEAELDKSQFRRWNPPGLPYNGYTMVEWRIENAWDKNILLGFANLDMQFTFDMGQVAKLSRFRINQRPESNLIYDFVHVKRFELWGSDSPNVSDDFGTWTFIGSFESDKPSGLPLGQVSNEDIEYAHIQGEEWDVPFEAPPVRYVRFVALETWGQGAVVQFMEMTFWGNPEAN